MSDSSEEFKQGEFRGFVTGKLEALEASQRGLERLMSDVHEDLNQFRSGMGERVERHERSIVAMETSLNIWKWALGSAFTFSAAAIVAAFWKLILAK